MNNIKSLRIFGTIYLWIFVLQALQICEAVEYRTDGEIERAAVVPDWLMKPYALQIFVDDNDDDDDNDNDGNDYTDDLLNERNVVATPLWRTLNKQLLDDKRLPLMTTKSVTKPGGNAMTLDEITFENLNDFNSYKIKNKIWPIKQQELNAKFNGNRKNNIKRQRQSLQQFALARSYLGNLGSGSGRGDGKQRDATTNIRYKQNGIPPIPIIMENHFKTKASRAIKKSNTFFNGEVRAGDEVKENLFPLKDDDNILNANDFDAGAADVAGNGVGVAVFVDEENGIANSNGNGSETLNYAANNEANTNYMMAQSNSKHHVKDAEEKPFCTQEDVRQQMGKLSHKAYDKRTKPSIGHTPFLPAVSGGAMTNLGKFFRDLSKNVHVSEQYQWNAEEQKLLEGDPNFGDIHHHLTKPNAATDQQTAEWIKAIRFYRPSQKIRSLVAMNPHGQWAHSSQFIDPNYMWVGLGK